MGHWSSALSADAFISTMFVWLFVWEKKKITTLISGPSSMFPLLRRDKLALPYFLLILLWNWAGNFSQKDAPTLIKYLSWVSMRSSTAQGTLIHSSTLSRPLNLIVLNKFSLSNRRQTSYATMAVWHALEYSIPAPARYPDLYTVLNVLLSAAGFMAFLAYFNYRQLVEVTESREGKAQKKKTK